MLCSTFIALNNFFLISSQIPWGFRVHNLIWSLRFSSIWSSPFNYINLRFSVNFLYLFLKYYILQLLCIFQQPVLNLAFPLSLQCPSLIPNIFSPLGHFFSPWPLFLPLAIFSSLSHFFAPLPVFPPHNSSIP